MNTATSQSSSHYYFLLYKPYGYLSQFINNASKRKSSKKLLGELANFPEGVMAVGRLDEKSEGLLLLTTDGKFSYQVNKQAKVEKEYYAQVDGIITETAAESLRKGVTINVHGKDYITKPCVVTLLSGTPEVPETLQKQRDPKHGAMSWVSICLTEGKFRQIRKMTACVGFPTIRLIRTRIGTLSYKNMKAGEVIQLPPAIQDTIKS